MTVLTKLSRRDFLAVSATGAGGLMLAIGLTPGRSPRAALRHLPDAAGAPLNLFLGIAEDGLVTIVASCPEIGQGARTALPAIIADELEADWARVRIVQALPDKRLGSQNVGGSSAIRENYHALRVAGASARAMLEQAAAKVWQVPAGECRAASHRIVHGPSGRTLDFGRLAAVAATLTPPPAEGLRLKTTAEFRYIGAAMGPVDGPDIVHGRAKYGIDIVVPGMKFAVMARPPVVGGRLKSFQATKTLAVRGVERVVEVKGGTSPPGYNSLGGLAVIADNSWAAIKGRDALEIEWDDGANAGYDSDRYRAELEATVAVPGTPVRNRGDAYQALDKAEAVAEADYYVPHQVHAPMEPPVAVADVRASGAEIWIPNQDPTDPKKAIARALGLATRKVIVHTPLAGGGFGRKGKPDYGVEAALLSRRIGAPVKLTWTREDDIRHGYYHAVCAQHLAAGLDKAGKVTAWLHRTAFPSISSTFREGVTMPSAGEMGLGCTDVPWDVAHIRCEKGRAISHLRTGWYRSVNNINHGFAVASFVDELAHRAGRDPAQYLLDLIGPARHIDFAGEEIEYSNHGKDLKDYPIDTARMKGVIRAVMAKADWGQPLPAGRGRGIAFHKSFLTYVAAVVEVAVGDDGKLSIPTVHYAVDCGRAVNPDRIRAQFEGGAVFAISTAVFGAVTAKRGRVEQSNFHDYEVTRMALAPMVHVDIVDSDAKPTGVGEPPVPPIAPALANAIFAATGKRIRQLPIGDQLKV